ncbi:hypothetical protein ABFG93_14475 [Pseudalkalibacillus hwajinpoensis]|uniref:hypothetical protein n=1 Tax=Guptibacillus hwajinpoensis TaxID=208199 RepID=UPI00325B4845
METKEREEAFRSELKRLRLQDYITGNTYEVVATAYQKMVQPAEDLDHAEPMPEVSSKHQKAIEPPAKPKKEKKVKSAQELRDRNLTWILIIGVVFLLLGALVLATSTWEVMTSAMKTALIAGISAVFFGISWLSGHKLKIEKTAFAFLILGSLFLPIVVLSAGYFQLFGEWLSVTGDGNEVLGLFGVLLCLPLYVLQAMRQRSRLFVWFSFVTLSIGAHFFIGMFNPSIDIFYFGIVLFNGLLLLTYTKTKHIESVALFTKELPIYAQGNLVLSTLLLLFFYESEVFYSFNVILTAVLYLAMVYIGKQKEYHFVFTFLLIYGIYQLIEHSLLGTVDVMVYALVGFLFIGIQMLEPFQTGYLKKSFQFTSAIVSFCAFFFISYKGLILRWDDPSWLLVLSYFLISLNYIYLANLSRFRVFGLLAPVFLAAAGLYPIALLYQNPSSQTVMTHMFVTALLLYGGGYYWNSWRYTKHIQTGSLFVSFGPMSLAVLIGLVTESWLLTSLFFLIVGMIHYTISRKAKWSWLRVSARGLNPVSWSLALLVLFPLLAQARVYENVFGFPFHAGITGVIIILIHYAWHQKGEGEEKLAETTFWTGVSVYGLALLFLITTPINELFIRTTMLLGATGVLFLIVKRTNELMLWYLISAFTLGAYLSAAEAFPLQGTLQWVIGSIVLIGIAEIAGKHEFVKKAFFYSAHLYLPMAIFYTAIDQENDPILYGIALLIYLYTILTRKREWEIRTFLYAGFTMLPFLYYSIVTTFELNEEAMTYIGFASGLVIFGLWLILDEKWKERIKWYAVPFAVIGLVPFAVQYIAIPLLPFALAVSYAIITLYVMHRSGWQLFTVLPLLFIILFIMLLPLDNIETISLVYVVSASFILTAGLFIHQKLFSFQAKRMLGNHLDWYSVAAFLLVLNVYGNALTQTLWVEELPAIFIVAFLALQIRRVPVGLPSRVVKSVTTVSLLIPYYTLLRHIDLNEYIVTEVYILPWIGLAIYLSKRTWVNEERIMRLVEWLVLSIVAAILVADALMSNTIIDALIAGSLSLISLLAGFFYRIKSYFIIGSSVLLLNLFLQTRPYWGNMPWWAYLLIAGSTLIAVASFYEWQKQNKDKEGNTLLQLKKQQWLARWNSWR